MLWWVLWCLGWAGYELTSCGYYRVPIIDGQVIEILMNMTVTVVIRFAPQENEFLQARIEIKEKTVCYNLSPRENAVLSGSVIRLWVIGKEDLPELEIWIIQPSICPGTVFEIPKASDVTLKLHADNIYTSTCVFFTGEYTINPVDIFYGFDADDDQSHFEIYSSHGAKIATPRYVCIHTFCKAHISFPAFARLRILRGVEPSAASAFIEIPKSSAFPGLDHYVTPTALPFYNFTGKFIVGHEYTVRTLNPVEYPPSRRKITMILTITFTVIMATLVIIRMASMVMIIGKDPYTPHSMTSITEPTRVILNQYCPTTSAVINVPHNRD